MKKNKKTSLGTIIIILLFICYYGYNEYFKDSLALPNTNEVDKKADNNIEEEINKSYDLNSIPEYSDKPYVILNNNEPDFEDLSHSTVSFEVYSELDSLERCREAYANLGKDLMPTEERKSIGSVKPTGWQTVKYDIVDGKYLYNRCHLIGFQLAGENANKNNLITCTRYMNTVAMLEFENKVANYIKATNNHVLYRVTPIFEENNLLSNGVIMEALSIEDNGEGIKFNVFVYNVQPGIEIDYKTGISSLIVK